MTGKQNRWMLLFILLLSVGAVAITFSNKLPLLGDVKARYGLDIQGGMRVVLRAKKEDFKGAWGPGNLEAVRRILENRVNATGVSEPVIITKPDDQVIVELPGLKNKEEALQQLQSTASLQFYLLRQLDTGEWTIGRKKDEKTGLEEEYLVDAKTGQPITKEQLEVVVFSRDPIVSGKDMLSNSRAVPSPATGKPVIEFEFNDEGKRIFEQTTRANIGKFLATFLDKRLIIAATINSVIPGRGEITGNFTLEGAKAVSDQLNAGALPVPLEIAEIRDLEATLGQEAVKATTTAGIIGLSLVLVFMLLYYRLPGFLANIALLLYTMFSIAVFKGGLKWLGVEPITLTLPGIAGFILSIGMAVDANILIFERMKEELRSGKTLRAAVDAGFKRAFTAIFDSNVCTALTCAILYNFGTGPIRGFALTLGLGVAISMFTAITVTRTFLFALVGMGFAQSPGLYGVGGEHRTRSLHVMRRKFLWLGLSVAIIVPGLLAWVGGGIKPSIDFRGGTELQVPFSQRHAADDIQRTLVAMNPKFKDSRVVVANDPGAAKVAYITTVRIDRPEIEQVKQTLAQKVGPLVPGQDVSVATVSGTISKELTKNAIMAVLFASLLIVLYLALRFSIGGFVEGLKYGTCAVIALLHDVAVVWGAFAILGMLQGWQIDSLFVTAMLTVIGFSVHDTIIVFDRIRENLQHRAKGESFSDLADRSIDQTIARSINTSLTVIITLTALFIAGGSAIHQFTGALLIGIVSGTYSSIFNASVLLVWWKQRDIATAGAPAPKSGLASRPAAPAPGDRPLVTPKAKPETAGVSATSVSEDGADAEEGGRTPRPTTPRRQPARRRRM